MSYFSPHWTTVWALQSFALSWRRGLHPNLGGCPPSPQDPAMSKRSASSHRPSRAQKRSHLQVHFANASNRIRTPEKLPATSSEASFSRGERQGDPSRIRHLQCTRPASRMPHLGKRAFRQRRQRRIQRITIQSFSAEFRYLTGVQVATGSHLCGQEGPWSRLPPRAAAA